MRPACDLVRAAIKRMDAEMGPMPEAQLTAFLPYPRGLIRATLRRMPDRPVPAPVVVAPAVHRCKGCGKAKPAGAFVERPDGKLASRCEACQVLRRVWRERKSAQAVAWRAFVAVPAINPGPLRWVA